MECKIKFTLLKWTIQLLTSPDLDDIPYCFEWWHLSCICHSPFASQFCFYFFSSFFFWLFCFPFAWFYFVSGFSVCLEDFFFFVSFGSVVPSSFILRGLDFISHYQPFQFHSFDFAPQIGAWKTGQEILAVIRKSDPLINLSCIQQMQYRYPRKWYLKLHPPLHLNRFEASFPI